MSFYSKEIFATIPLNAKSRHPLFYKPLSLDSLHSTKIMFKLFLKQLFALCCLTLLCSSILDTKKESYIHNFLGKNPSSEDVAKLRDKIDLEWGDRFTDNFKSFLYFFTFSFGYSEFHRQPVLDLILDSTLVSLTLAVPSLLLGLILAFLLAYFSLYAPPLLSKTLSLFISFLNSLHLVSFILLFQLFLCSSYWLGYFPVQGWRVKNLYTYFYYGSVPISIMSLMLASFYSMPIRSDLKEEMEANYNLTFRSIGMPIHKLVLFQHSKKALIIILAHSYKLVPSYLLGGNLLIENHFNIPGLGFVAYSSCLAGDKKTLLALIWLVGLSYFVFQHFFEALIHRLDPREELSL